MIKEKFLKARVQRIKEAIGGRKPSEFLPIDFGPNFGRVQTKEELLNLIASLDDYEFNKFVFLFKFWATGEKDSNLWRFDKEREIFKGETNPVRRLELLLEFYDCAIGFELELKDLEDILRVQGERAVDRFLMAHKKVILYHGWHVGKDEEGFYIFRKKSSKEVRYER